MTPTARIVSDRYVDSVVLMRLAQQLTRIAGVTDAAAVMGTATNRALLAEGGFDAKGVADAGANDLIVAVKAVDAATAVSALDQVDALLAAPVSSTDRVPTVITLDDAVGPRTGTNLAVISLPGEYAAAEARHALERGLHVFIFSSNVPLDDELELKRLAAERGLLCMGPDCGTALIAGTGLGFANAVRRGPVGVVGASGTGIQAVTSLLDRFGVGVSHAIGAGSRDLSDAVAGATTFAGLDALLEDPGTEAVVVVSKPPGPATAARLRELAAVAPKPVILCFLDELTLDDAARAAAEAVGFTPPALPEALALPVRPGRGRRWIRGLYAGGSLAYEAEFALRQAGLDIGSGHAIVDLGGEEFTRGRPHPMIDARARRALLKVELADPETAVVLLDVVLGYGAAADPAGDLADVIADARGPVVLASVCGTERDPQGLAAQEATLREAGAHVLPTNSAAARTAALLVSQGSR